MSAVPPPPVRATSSADWVLMGGVALTLAWTTLCLGGYLAETMVWTSRAIWFLAAVALVRAAFTSASEPVQLSWVVLLPVPFLLYALASVVWIAPAEWLGWREWLHWLQVWLVFALVVNVGWGRGPTRLLVFTVLGLALVGVAIAAYQRFVDTEWMMLGRRQSQYFIGRSAGTFGAPNSFATQMELILPACLVLLGSRAVSPATKILCAWLAVLFGAALVLTGSRGGWLGVGVALLAWPLLAGGDWRKRLLGTLGLAAALVAVFALLYRYSPQARERLQPMLDGTFEVTRPIIWKAGWQIWQTAPWSGTGAASYNVLFNQHRPRGFGDNPQWTHNEYLNILGDYGVAGFVLWAGAGAGLLLLGWRAVRRARRATVPGGTIFVLWRWKFGLWLGLVAFAVHLVVDFHSRIPALAFMCAAIFALLLRDETAWQWTMPRRWWVRGGCFVGIFLLAAVWIRRADPLYRAEAARFEPVREIDRRTRAGREDFQDAIPPALEAARRATGINPADGQAWADYSYMLALSWHVHRGDTLLPWLLAEQAAKRALELCPVSAEYWVRLGVAQDMLAKRGAAEGCFRRAVELAPNNTEYWYYLAYHYAGRTGREEAAREALATCLNLDPGNRQGIALRERLQARNLRN